jgi:hypothetical protein
MISPLDDQPLSEVMDMLQELAEKTGVLKSDEALSVSLIAFAEEVWMQAYEQGIKDESLYQEMKG